MRLLAIVEYDGTDFAGFQLQRRPDRPATEQPRTVQAELERAIAAATGQTVHVVGSGRTDTGVHAAGQAVHVDLGAPLAGNLPQLQRALNAHLPRDVAVRMIRAVPAGFHARFSALSRTYCYRIVSGNTPSPLLRRYAHHIRLPLTVERMADAAGRLVGIHDFTAFAAQEASRRTTREVLRAEVGEWWANPPAIWHTDTRRCRRCSPSPALFSDSDLARVAATRVVEVRVEANAFLRHMMRRIVGTLVRVGSGSIEPADVASILAAGDRAQAGPTAPAKGLCLEQVTYNLALDDEE